MSALGRYGREQVVWYEQSSNDCPLPASPEGVASRVPMVLLRTILTGWPAAIVCVLPLAVNLEVGPKCAVPTCASID